MVTSNVTNRRDERGLPRFSIATYRFACSAGTSASTIQGPKMTLNGKLKDLIHKSADLDPDTDYTFEILDEDGTIVYTEGSIADNKPDAGVHTNLTRDNVVFLDGEYTPQWTWTTARVITANDFLTTIKLE